MTLDAQALFDEAPCGYLVADADGVLVAVNRAFCELTGQHAAELIGRRFVDLLTGGGRIYHETHFVPMLRLHGRVRAVALDLARADGTRLPVLVNADLATDADNNVLATRIVTFDATERRTYERELLAATRRAEAAQSDAVALAQTLQASLIPPVPPTVPGLEIATAYRPAGNGSQVGGDFYDVFQATTDEWVVLIGDVQGKGVDAAVVSALARHTLRAATVRTASPRDALDELNAVLLAHDTDRFLTAVVLRLRHTADDWQVVSANGGHALPILVRAEGRPTPYGRSGTVIGVVPAPLQHDDTAVLHPGDILMLYTDGVTEARSSDDTFYGEHRLADRLAASPADALVMTHGLLDDVLAFQDGNARDDIAIVTLRVTRAVPAAVAGAGWR